MREGQFFLQRKRRNVSRETFRYSFPTDRGVLVGDYATGATGSTLPVAWMSVISFRGHLAAQAPQEVHLL